MGLRIDENKILKEIERLLDRRNKITSLTEYYYSTLDIYNLMYVYSELTREKIRISMQKNSKFSNYMSKYIGMIDTNAYLYFLNQEEHTRLSESVLDTFDKSGFIYYGRKDVNKLSEKEFFEIERDFLGTYDDRLLKLLDEATQRGLIDMRGKNKNSATTFMRMCSNNHYTLMPEGYDIEGLVMLSHELGHLYSHVVLDVRSKKQLRDTFLTYYESYSHYLEQCLFEYLKQNHIYLPDTLIDENNYYAWLQGHFEELNMCRQISKGEEDIDLLMLINNAYPYSYGMLIGILLHERYLENPNETKKNIDNFLFNQGLLDKDEELEILGLSKEDLNNPKVLSKRLQKHNEFIKLNSH